MTVDISQSLINKNPPEIYKVSEKQIEEDDDDVDFKKNSQDSKVNESFSNNIANSTGPGTHSDSLKGIPYQLAGIHDTATPSLFTSKQFGNTVFSKNSSQDGNYSIRTSNMRNIKTEMKHNLLFTIKENNDDSNTHDGNTKVFWMNNIVILDQEVKSNPQYEVYDNQESDLLWKDKLTITAAGYEKGLRHVRDGYTFFGVNESFENCIINDYLVNLPAEYKGKCPKRLFVIFFDRESSKFYFRSLKESDIYIYVKISKNYKLKKKKYFQIGDIVFHAEPSVDNGLKISIHKENSNNKYEEHFFDSNSEEVLLGRSDICNIKLESNILSKVHCTFKFNIKEKAWYVSDGTGERSSTNGTWMFCNSKYELNDEETQAKIGKSVITIKKI